MFILLAGMAFQSGVTPVGSRSYTFLTVVVAGVLVVSTVIFVGVLVLEVYKSTRYAQRHRRSVSSAAKPKAPRSGSSDWLKFSTNTSSSLAEASPLSRDPSPLHTVMVGREHTSTVGQLQAPSTDSDRGTIMDRLLRRRRLSISVRTRANSFVKSSSSAASLQVGHSKRWSPALKRTMPWYCQPFPPSQRGAYRPVGMHRLKSVMVLTVTIVEIMYHCSLRYCRHCRYRYHRRQLSRHRKCRIHEPIASIVCFIKFTTRL